MYIYTHTTSGARLMLQCSMLVILCGQVSQEQLCIHAFQTLHKRIWCREQISGFVWGNRCLARISTCMHRHSIHALVFPALLALQPLLGLDTLSLALPLHLTAALALVGCLIHPLCMHVIEYLHKCTCVHTDMQYARYRCSPAPPKLVTRPRCCAVLCLSSMAACACAYSHPSRSWTSRLSFQHG
jgi:hypothetical protein